MKTRSKAIAERRNLLDLSPEIFAILEAFLEIREIAKLILTCKLIKNHIDCFLYKKVFISRRSKNTNTRFFVSLFRRSPEIVVWVHKFVIDEYDIEYFPQLLAFTFPNLENLIMQHEGRVSPVRFGKHKLTALHARVKPQPILQNLTFNIETQVRATIKDSRMYSLPASASTFFRHPKLKRMRLSFLDFTDFDHLPEAYFSHSQLGELFLERCRYSAKNLRQLVHPCKSLSKLCLYTDQTLPFPENKLPTILQPVKDTLRVLKLVWAHLDPSTTNGMDFNSFSNLHAIMAHPKFLFGSPYTTASPTDLSDLIISKLPPNLLILALEGIVRINPNNLPPPPPGFAIPDQPIPDHDVNLMRHILTHRNIVAPSLDWLVVYYLEHMQNIPKSVIALAKKMNVKCCELYQYDEIAPPKDMSLFVRGKEWEGGKETSDGCYTVLEHRPSDCPWPEQIKGNY